VKTSLLTALFLAICLVTAVAQTTEQDWQREAVRRYPALGVAGSPLNKSFLAEYQRRKQMPAQAAFFANPRWPMLLADECARQAAAGTGPPASPMFPGFSANRLLPAVPAALPRGLPAFPNAGAVAGPLIIVFVVALFVGLLIGAVFVRLATQIVAGFTPSFGMACATLILSFAASFAVGLVIGFLRIAGGGGSQVSPGMSAFTVLVSLAVQACVYGAVLKDNTTPIGAGKGCLVSIVQTILVIVVVVGIALIAGLALPIFTHPR
jgi:hypothetical protein